MALKRGIQVTALDALTYAGHLENVENLSSQGKFELVRGDIQDFDFVTRLFQSHKFDAVLNFAAETHVDRSIEGPRAFIETNVFGTFTMLQCSLNHWQTLSGEQKDRFRYLQISTDEVYGSLGPTGHFSETTSMAPNSPYSASKASGDMLVRAWVRSFGVQATISNCSNNYGPYQHVEKFIPRQITEILESRKPKLYGSGENVRDWIHTEDHSSAVLAILEKGKIGETYMIGANGEKNNKEVIKQILQTMGKDPNDYAHVDDRPGHDLRYAIDSTKLQSELGWEPVYTDFTKGLADTIQWYKNNEAWWKPQKAETEAKYSELGR
jgi:dTDP-glucose 4,6-dehydratase